MVFEGQNKVRVRKRAGRKAMHEASTWGQPCNGKEEQECKKESVLTISSNLLRTLK